MDELTHIIDGKRVVSDRWFDTIDPTTRRPWARVARASVDDAARAVAPDRCAALFRCPAACFRPPGV